MGRLTLFFLIAAMLSQGAFGCSVTQPDELRELSGIRGLNWVVKESNLLSGQYLLTADAPSGIRFCHLLLDRDDGDDFIGFQGLWFGPDCRRGFKVLAEVEGWGPGESGEIRFYRRDQDGRLSSLTFKSVDTDKFEGNIGKKAYRLMKLDDR